MALGSASTGAVASGAGGLIEMHPQPQALLALVFLLRGIRTGDRPPVLEIAEPPFEVLSVEA